MADGRTNGAGKDKLDGKNSDLDDENSVGRKFKFRN